MKIFVKTFFKIFSCIFSTIVNIMIAFLAAYVLFLLFGNIFLIKVINLIIIISSLIYSIQETYENFKK